MEDGSGGLVTINCISTVTFKPILLHFYKKTDQWMLIDSAHNNIM